MEVNCDFCNKVFEIPPSRFKKNQKKIYCSTNCYYKTMPKQKLEKCKKCSGCMKKSKFITICNRCYIKDYNKRNPEKHEKYKLQNRNYQRLKKGIPLDLPNLVAPAGSGWINNWGYKVICKKGHPNASKYRGTILEHVWIMSEHIKRPLRKGESVHHKNGIKNDNRIENLELWHRGQPAGQRVEDKINFYKQFLESYGFQVIKLDDTSPGCSGNDHS